MRHNLRFYRWFDSVGWPPSYIGKLFLIAFIATHLPLLCVIGYLLFKPAPLSFITILGLIFPSTLLGSALLLWALYELLKPVLLAAEALQAYFVHRQVLALPTNGRDEVGSLLRNVAAAIETCEEQRASID